MGTDVTLTVKGEIARLRLLPGDKVIVSFERQPSRVIQDAVSGQVKAIFPDHEVVLLSGGMALSVAGADDGEGLEGLETE